MDICRWAPFNREAMDAMEEMESADAVCRCLVHTCQWKDGASGEVVGELLGNVLGMMRERGYSLDVQSTALGIVFRVLKHDADHWETTATSSCEFFQELLLSHAVERPPSSIAVFSEVQVSQLMDFVLPMYYAHFHAYKHALSHKPKLTLIQTRVADLEQPPRLAPLSDALME